MAKRRMVTCMRCGAQFRPGKIIYHYDAKARRYICNSCYRYEQRGNRSFIDKYKQQSAASPIGQPVWAFVVKLLLGLVYFFSSFSDSAPETYNVSKTFLLILGVVFLVWAIVPIFVARARKAERQAAIENQIRVEVERIENEPKRCPSCGAVTKGNVCEYCGTEL